MDARWVVDASGRAGVLKRKLGLAEANAHDANAVWWRVEGLLDPNDWSDDAAWRDRCTPPDRWRSTNHMCGTGYWFWLIPLASGAHSLGIVCDATLHPLETMDTHDKAMDWLRRHQPRVAAALEGHAVMDFRFLRHFSHGCREVFGERWALTGEAGLFLDPFYSPGSDFIAISNGYICDMIEKDRAGQSFAAYAEIYQQLYFSFYENTLTLYQDQYPLFGDAQVMPLKVIWNVSGLGCGLGGTRRTYLRTSASPATSAPAAIALRASASLLLPRADTRPPSRKTQSAFQPGPARCTLPINCIGGL